MPPRETSKQRSIRIPLDYYKRSDRLTRLKVWLSAAAAVAAALWASGLGWDVRRWPQRAERSRVLASHGTLARAHASWDNDCEACHVPFRPIDGSAWPARLVASPRGSDARCERCHAGPSHHASQAPGDVGSCASCHRDHRGRDASLTATDDVECTRCHADLGGHMADGLRPGFVASVTAFGADASRHPEFALFRSAPGPPRDPGRLAFNHALHVAPGLNPEPGGRHLKTLAELPEGDRERYRPPGGRDADPVRLRCDSCHSMDGPRVRPVRYESHCRACHPLDYAPGLPPVRHGLQPAEVFESLWQAYAGQHLRGNPDLPSWRPPPRPVPGREERPEVRAAREAVGRDVARAGRVLFGDKKCGECHAFETPDGRPVASPTAAPDAGGPPSFRVAGPGVPQVWFRHAAFDHAAHRSFECRGCHAAAYPDAPAPSRTSSDVILPAVAVCRTCHAPRSGDGKGGAGHSCTECHRYHGSDDPAPRRDAGLDAGLRQFLLGSARGHRGRG